MSLTRRPASGFVGVVKGVMGVVEGVGNLTKGATCCPTRALSRPRVRGYERPAKKALAVLMPSRNRLPFHQPKAGQLTERLRFKAW